ncbi:hypothetical protein GGU10DRAFT_384566 [Lentinula aff. detonsa]|uniref:ubiquitinyl hydrolase 1 n=1 Tax=Lentinula aff. detonsa TaxID=2804958 RepID=A0AA38KGW6_9AGAR|nr:hypothetical protein GGU10DRAFT_384566 [Lentinula aff. detonsa]
MLTIPPELGDSLLNIITSNTFQQIFPLLVIFLVPFSVLYFARSSPRPSTRLSFFFYSTLMVLESIGLALPWNWGNSISSNHTPKKKGRKRAVKSEKFELKPGQDACAVCYPGLVNISGTYCFMNSTVQALSSLSYLQPHIEAIHSKAEALDVPSPIIDALRDLFHALNDPRSRPSSIRPLELISVLSSAGRANSLFNSREHQDAQELFQLLSECIKSEIAAIDKESARDRGLGGLSQEVETKIGKSVFDGLTANRRSCVVCGYTEAVMHFPFDNWQLAVPPMTSTCLLEDCLSDYTRLEVLKDCICRKCSMTATHRRLKQEIQILSQVENPSASKKRRLKDVKKMAAKVKAALDEGRIEDELKDVRMEKVISLSTKQAMIARPPPVLVLHINRSMHFAHYASKNNICVIFPEVLDLTQFTTSGNLSTVPTSSLSTPPPHPKRSTTPTPEPRDSSSRTIYRLSAVVCHFGQHSFGHYICYRRKPKNSSGKLEDKWRPPRLVIELLDEAIAPSPIKREPDVDEVRIEGEDEGFEEYIWDDADPSTAAGTGKGWLRVSDDAVTEVGIESVLQEGSGAFMLYYERAVISGIVHAGLAHGGGSPYPQAMCMNMTNGHAINGSSKLMENGYPVGVGVGVGTPLNSEETLKPQRTMTMMMNGNGSIGSLVSVDEKGRERDMMSWSSMSASGSPPVVGPRVVRSVAAGRRRSRSAAPGTSEKTSPPMSLTPYASSSSSMLSPTSPTYLSLASSQPIAVPNNKARSKAEDTDGFDEVDLGRDDDDDTSSSLSTNSNRPNINHVNGYSTHNYYNSPGSLNSSLSSLSSSAPALIAKVRNHPMSMSNTSIASMTSIESTTSTGSSAVSVPNSSVSTTSTGSAGSTGSTGSGRRGRGRSVHKPGGPKGRSPHSMHPPLQSSPMVGLKA